MNQVLPQKTDTGTVEIVVDCLVIVRNFICKLKNTVNDPEVSVFGIIAEFNDTHT